MLPREETAASFSSMLRGVGFPLAGFEENDTLTGASSASGGPVCSNSRLLLEVP